MTTAEAAASGDMDRYTHRFTGDYLEVFRDGRDFFVATNLRSAGRRFALKAIVDLVHSNLQDDGVDDAEKQALTRLLIRVARDALRAW
jgi:hypothetical protein